MYQFIAYDIKAPLRRQGNSDQGVYTMKKKTTACFKHLAGKLRSAGSLLAVEHIEKRRKWYIVIHLAIGMCACGCTVLKQIDHSVEQLLFVGNSADTRYSSLECESPCSSRRDQKSWCWLHFLLEWTQEWGDAWSKSRICNQNRPRQISGLPKGINDRLMKLTLPFSCNKHVTIISTNALTITNPDEVMTSSTMIWKMLFLQHPVKTSSSFSETKMA